MLCTHTHTHTFTTPTYDLLVVNPVSRLGCRGIVDLLGLEELPVVEQRAALHLGEVDLDLIVVITKREQEYSKSRDIYKYKCEKELNHRVPPTIITQKTGEMCASV